MNYIRSVNQFWYAHEILPFSHGETVLYFAILKCGNSLHWKEPFSIPNTTLMKLCNINRQQLTRYRKQLIERGLIQYINGTRWNPGGYRICSLYSTIALATDTQNDTQNDTQDNTQNNTQDDTIIKKEKEKENKKEKQRYASSVLLTESEYQLLLKEFGTDLTQQMIEELNWYKERSGKQYFSDYAAIRGWVCRRVQERKKSPHTVKTNLAVYEDDYDHVALERLSRKKMLQ